MYTKGNDLLNVCGGDSHCRAELEGEVEKMMRNLEWLERETVRDCPLIGSMLADREKGIGVFVTASITELTESERVSSVRSPV